MTISKWHKPLPTFNGQAMNLKWWNEQWVDNMNETFVAKATAKGQIVAARGPQDIIVVGPAGDGEMVWADQTAEGGIRWAKNVNGIEIIFSMRGESDTGETGVWKCFKWDPDNRFGQCADCYYPWLSRWSPYVSQVRFRALFTQSASVGAGSHLGTIGFCYSGTEADHDDNDVDGDELFTYYGDNDVTGEWYTIDTTLDGDGVTTIAERFRDRLTTDHATYNIKLRYQLGDKQGINGQVKVCGARLNITFGGV